MGKVLEVACILKIQDQFHKKRVIRLWSNFWMKLNAMKFLKCIENEQVVGVSLTVGEHADFKCIENEQVVGGRELGSHQKLE